MSRLSNLRVADVRADQSFLSNLEDALEGAGAGWIRFGPSMRHGDSVVHRFDEVAVSHRRDGTEHILGIQVYGLNTTIRLMTDGSLPAPDESHDGRRRTLSMIEDVLVVIRQAVCFRRSDVDTDGDRFVRALCAMRPRRKEEADFPFAFLMAGPWTPFGLTSNNDFRDDPLCRELAALYAPAGRIAPLRVNVIQTTTSDGERLIAILPAKREWNAPDDPMSGLRDLDELNRRIATGTPW